MPIISARRRFNSSSPAVHVGGGGGPAAPFGLDGSAAIMTSGTTHSATLSTTYANDIIVACFIPHSNVNTTSVADVAGLTWTLIANETTSGNFTSMWYAKSSGILTSDIITVTLAGSATCSLHVFGVSGANFTTPLDSNGALPGTASGGGATISLTTSNADDFLMAVYRMGAQEFPTAGTGWTTIKGQDYLLTQYKIVTATQSGVTVPMGTGSGDQNKGIGHAIVKA